MTTSRSCSWCGAMNVVPWEYQSAGQPVTCKGCSHRADLPRVWCDCPACSEPAARHVLALLRAGPGEGNG